MEGLLNLIDTNPKVDHKVKGSTYRGEILNFLTKAYFKDQNFDKSFDYAEKAKAEFEKSQYHEIACELIANSRSMMHELKTREP